MPRHTEVEWCKLKDDLQSCAIQNPQTSEYHLSANNIISILNLNNFWEIAQKFKVQANITPILDDSYPLGDIILVINKLKSIEDDQQHIQVELEPVKSIEFYNNQSQQSEVNNIREYLEDRLQYFITREQLRFAVNTIHDIIGDVELQLQQSHSRSEKDIIRLLKDYKDVHEDINQIRLEVYDIEQTLREITIESTSVKHCNNTISTTGYIDEISDRITEDIYERVINHFNRHYDCIISKYITSHQYSNIESANTSIDTAHIPVLEACYGRLDSIESVISNLKHELRSSRQNYTTVSRTYDTIKCQYTEMRGNIIV